MRPTYLDRPTSSAIERRLCEPDLRDNDVNLTSWIWFGVRLLLAIGLLLRLGGSAGSWVPPLWLLTVLLLILPVIEWATDRSEAHPTRNWHAWASAVRNNQFGAVLLLLAAAGTAVRVLSLASDLGQTPIDIDETRLAVSVLSPTVAADRLSAATVDLLWCRP